MQEQEYLIFLTLLLMVIMICIYNNDKNQNNNINVFEILRNNRLARLKSLNTSIGLTLNESSI